MRFPARLRWSTPLGQKIELCETIDVSRAGVLLSVKEPHSAGVLLWVTVPYDESLRDGQPEILARAVRCEEKLEAIRAQNSHKHVQSRAASERERSAKVDQLACALGISDAPATFVVALRFEEQRHAPPNGNRSRQGPERRGSPRRVLAVPVRVRPEDVPWFEEAMTVDFSSIGMRFRSRREYAVGDTLKISLQDVAFAPWVRDGESRARVVRVLPGSDPVSRDVCVCRV
jgi:hypothetical protein